MPKHLGRIVVPTRSSAPASPSDGEIYYNTVENKLFYRAGSSHWKGLSSTGVPAYNETSTDVSTSSTSFVDLMSMSVPTTGGDLIIYAAISGSHTAAATRTSEVVVTVNGVNVGGTVIYTTANTQTVSGVILCGAVLSAGLHTVALRWRTTGSGSVRVRTGSLPDRERAAIAIYEVR